MSTKIHFSGAKPPGFGGLSVFAAGVALTSTRGKENTLDWDPQGQGWSSEGGRRTGKPSWPSTCPPSALRRWLRKVPGLLALCRMTTPSIDGSGMTLYTSLPKCTELFLALRRASDLLHPRLTHFEKKLLEFSGHGGQDSTLGPGRGYIFQPHSSGSHLLDFSHFSDWPSSHPTFHPLLSSQPFFSQVHGGPIDNLIKNKRNHPRTCPKPPACVFVRHLVSLSTASTGAPAERS